MLNLQRIIPQIKRTLIATKSIVSATHTRECYRNRVGIDASNLDNALIQPMLFFAILRAFKTNLTEWVMPNHNINSTARAIKYTFPTNHITLKYSGDTPININAVIQVLSNSIAFATNAVGLGECVHIINYRTKEALTNDAEVVEKSEHFVRAEKATEILLTTAPHTVVRVYEHRSNEGIVRIILTYGISRNLIDRLKVIVFTDQLAQLTTDESEEYRALAEIVAHNSEYIITNLPNLLTERFIQYFIETYFADKLNELDKLIQDATLRRITEQLDNITTQTLAEKLSVVKAYRSELYQKRQAYEDIEQKYTAAMNAWEAAKYEEDTTTANIKKFFTALGIKLKDLAVTDDNIYVIADTILTYFDGRKLKAYKNNPRSPLCTAPAWERDLIEKVFEQRTAKIHITAGFKMNLKSGRLNAVHKHEAISTNYEPNMRTGIPNPHHEHYNCFGDNSRICSELVIQGKLDEALMTIYAALGGLNIADTAVFNAFINDLNCEEYYNLAFIEIDGNMVTPAQYRRLYEKEQESKTQEAEAHAQN